MGKFFLKWKDDMMAAQDSNGRIADKVPGKIHYGWNGTDPVWVSEVILGAYDIYLAYGDKQALEEIYPTLERLIGYYKSLADAEYIIRSNKWGDHIGLDKPDPAFLSTAYFYQMVKVMEKITGVLDREQERKMYLSLSAKIKGGINANFFHDDTYDNNSQGANAVALHFGLVPGEKRSVVLNALEKSIIDRDFHVTTGGATTYNLMNVLWMFDKTELAYKIASRKTFPSWGFWVENGASTSWEQWNIRNTSRNHGWLGSYLGVWMIKALGGISALEPGYRKIKIMPGIIEGLNYASCSIETMSGPVMCTWTRISGNRLTIEVTIPSNTTARIYIPSSKASSISEGVAAIWSSGKATKGKEIIRLVETRERHTVWDIGSGKYDFVISGI